MSTTTASMRTSSDCFAVMGMMSKSLPTLACPAALIRCTLAHAIRDGRAILTRNYRDFESLHDLVVAAAGGHHGGMLVVRYDSNPRNNMTAGDIARAIRNLAAASVPLADACHELNHGQ